MRSRLGHIRELGPNHFEVSVEIGCDPKTGLRRRKYKTVRGSKRQAQRELNILAAKYSVSIGEEETDLTVREYADNIYLDRIQKEVERRTKTGKGRYKQRTYDSYEGRLRLHILPIIGDLKISEVRPKHIRKVENEAPSQAMRIEVHKVMSAMFKEATFDELIDSNPVAAVRPPEPTDYEPTVLDAEDLAVYLWHFANTRVEPAVLLAIGGSYRRGEILALNVDDINLETGKVTIDDELINSSVGVLNDDPKNRKARTNILPLFIVERLRKVLPKSGPVMQTLAGARMNPDGLRSLYNRTLAKLPEDVPRIPLKNLRHSSLTAIYDATGSLERARGHGGHLNQAVTQKHYIRAHDNQERLTAEAVDAFFQSVLPDFLRPNSYPTIDSDSGLFDNIQRSKID